jgi:hypothetical protein
MRDPQGILSRARQGSAPSTWRIFSKKRGLIGGFFSGTANDPDPQLVFTSEGVIEYVNEKKPLAVIDFDDLSEITLRVDGSSFSDSSIVHLDVWLDLLYLNGKKVKWRSSSFQGNLQVIQCFIETHGVHKALHRK